MQQKQVPDLFRILANNPKQPLHTINSFKVRYFERGSSKSLKKGSFVFLFQTQSLSTDKIIKKKRPGASDQLLFRLRNKFKKVPLLVMCYLTKFDDVI